LNTQLEGIPTKGKRDGVLQIPALFAQQQDNLARQAGHTTDISAAKMLSHGSKENHTKQHILQQWK